MTTEIQTEVPEITPPAQPTVDPAQKELVRPWVQRLADLVNAGRGDRAVYKTLKRRLARARDVVAGLRAGIDATETLTNERGFATVNKDTLNYIQRFQVAYPQLEELTDLFALIGSIQAKNDPAKFTDENQAYGPDFVETQSHDLAALLLSDGIESVKVDRDILTVRTRPVTITSGKTGKKYFFGRFEMYFDCKELAKQEGAGDNGKLHVRGVDNIKPKNGGDYIHPHIQEGGWFCQGDGGHPIRNALGRLDVASATLVGLSVIRHYNENGNYDIERWASPSCDSCGAFMQAPGATLEAGHVHRLGVTAENKTICVNCGFTDQIDNKIYVKRQQYHCPHCGKHTNKKNVKRALDNTACCTACVDTVNATVRAARKQFVCPNCGEVHQRPEGADTWNPEVITITGKTGCTGCVEQRAVRPGWQPIALLRGEEPTIGTEGGTPFVRVGDLKVRLQAMPVACPNCGHEVRANELRKDIAITQVNQQYCPHCAVDGHSPVLWTRPNNMRALALTLLGQRLGAQLTQATSYAPMFAMNADQLKALCLALERTERLLPQRGEGQYEHWVENMRRVLGDPLPFEVTPVMRGAFNNFYR